MIPLFHSRVLGNERPPFEPSGRRLRITVYCPQTHLLSLEDQFRLHLLRELAGLDALRVVGTDRSFPWRVVIDPTPNEHGAAVVDIINPENQWASGHGFYAQDWTKEAIRLLGIDSPTDPRASALALRLPVLAAHTQTYRDLFITSCPDFLALRSRIPEANVVDLREGASDNWALPSFFRRLYDSRFSKGPTLLRSRHVLLGVVQASATRNVEVFFRVPTTRPGHVQQQPLPRKSSRYDPYSLSSRTSGTR